MKVKKHIYENGARIYLAIDKCDELITWQIFNSDGQLLYEGGNDTEAIEIWREATGESDLPEGFDFESAIDELYSEDSDCEDYDSEEDIDDA